MMKGKYVFIIAMIAFLVGYGMRAKVRLAPNIVTHTDSTKIVVINTNKVQAPTPVKISNKDYLFIPYKRFAFLSDEIIDTLGLSVTSEGITLKRESKIYQDSTFKAQITGIDAKLDWIETYPRVEYNFVNTTTTLTHKQPKWLVYAVVSYELYNTHSHIPIGVRLQYTPRKVSYYAEYSYDVLNRNNIIEFGLNFPIVKF